MVSLLAQRNIYSFTVYVFSRYHAGAANATLLHSVGLHKYRSTFSKPTSRPFESLLNFKKIADSIFAVRYFWQGRRDSNPQPTVLETATLPLSHSPIQVAYGLLF